MSKTPGARLRRGRKEVLLAACRSFLVQIDALARADVPEPGADWWDQISSLLRAGLGQDPQISRGFEGARSAFLRARNAEARHRALRELRSTLELASSRIESMPSGLGPVGGEATL